MKEQIMAITDGTGINVSDGNGIFFDDPRIAELERRMAALEEQARQPQSIPAIGINGTPMQPYSMYEYSGEKSPTPDRVVRRPRCRPTGA